MRDLGVAPGVPWKIVAYVRACVWGRPSCRCRERYFGELGESREARGACVFIIDNGLAGPGLFGFCEYGESLFIGRTFRPIRALVISWVSRGFKAKNL